MMKITDMQSKFMILTNNIKMIRVMVHSATLKFIDYNVAMTFILIIIIIMVTVPAVFLSPVVGDKVDCC